MMDTRSRPQVAPSTEGLEARIEVRPQPSFGFGSLRSRKWLLGLGAIGCLAIAAVYVSLRPATYTASSQLLIYIVIPQAFRRMVPAFTNRTIEVAKLTTVASAVAYGDLLYYAKLVADTEYRPIETFSVVALIFIVVLIPFSVLAKHLEDRLHKAG